MAGILIKASGRDALPLRTGMLKGIPRGPIAAGGRSHGGGALIRVMGTLASGSAECCNRVLVPP